MMDFLAALGLMFVIEGVLFAALPQAMRRAMASAMGAPDAILRVAGIGCAVLGLILIFTVRG